MLKYFQHGNRTTFDLKIMQGLFEEYVSDSDEEGKENRVMNTEEKIHEFYSLALPKEDEPKRKDQFNSKPGVDNMLDLSGLRSLYNNGEGLASIGPRSISNIIQTHSEQYITKKSMKKSVASPLTEMYNTKAKKKEKKSKEGWQDHTISKRSHQLSNQNSEKVYRITESDEDLDDSDYSKKKNEREMFNEDENNSVLDLDVEEDLITQVEKKISEGHTQVSFTQYTK